MVTNALVESGESGWGLFDENPFQGRTRKEN
jgi:hypothetical protein